MTLPDLTRLERNAEEIINGLDPESVDVYAFLSEQFARGSVLGNRVFQFVYRSFYRLDNAGLSQQFKTKYFELLEASRGRHKVDVKGLVRELHAFPNLKGQHSLQFSFVTKLANTVNDDYPVYDGEVGSVFGFRRPHNYKSTEVRLEEYLSFYQRLRAAYEEILATDSLRAPRELFRQRHPGARGTVSEAKVIDFILWSAGKLGLKAGELCP